MKTSKHIGKVAYMKGGYIPDFIGGGTPEHFKAAGLTYENMIQTVDNEDVNVIFAVIVGEIETDTFTSVMTKEEANTLIRSWFVPEYRVTREAYFERYLDFHLTPARLDHIATLATEQDILSYLHDEGFKFIKMSEFTGPQFEV